MQSIKMKCCNWGYTSLELTPENLSCRVDSMPSFGRISTIIGGVVGAGCGSAPNCHSVSFGQPIVRGREPLRHGVSILGALGPAELVLADPDFPFAQLEHLNLLFVFGATEKSAQSVNLQLYSGAQVCPAIGDTVPFCPLWAGSNGPSLRSIATSRRRAR